MACPTCSSDNPEVASFCHRCGTSLRAGGGDAKRSATYAVQSAEGVTQFADTDAERSLKELFQTINRSEHLLIGDADVSALSSGFGFVGDFKAGRRGIALRPDAFDGDSVFKTPFPKVKRSEFPEGRGIFVQNGRTTTVPLPIVVR